jgi:hypothetical protein
MAESARPFLRPGEQIQAIFPGQTANPYLVIVTGLLFFLGLNRYRIFVATPYRILVLDSGKINFKKAQRPLTELPRFTTLGPASGVWHSIYVEGARIRVHRRFFKDIAAADAVLAPR